MYSARSYIILKNSSGDTKTFYGNVISNSVYDVAKTAYNYKETTGVYKESSKTREYLLNNIISIS